MTLGSNYHALIVAGARRQRPYFCRLGFYIEAYIVTRVSAPSGLIFSSCVLGLAEYGGENSRLGHIRESRLNVHQ